MLPHMQVCTYFWALDKLGIDNWDTGGIVFSFERVI
jgi:hypothetical protein